MFFVIDKARLKRVIAIVRDDRTKGQQGSQGPFLRLEASGDKLKITGRAVEGEFPATVYEPGVLFLRVTKFRLALGMIDRDKTLAIQVHQDGLLVDNMRFPLESNDMLLYLDPAKAPEVHPNEATDLVDQIARGVETLDDLVVRMAAIRDRLRNAKGLGPEQRRRETQKAGDELAEVVAKITALRETFSDKTKGTLFEGRV